MIRITFSEKNTRGILTNHAPGVANKNPIPLHQPQENGVHYKLWIWHGTKSAGCPPYVDNCPFSVPGTEEVSQSSYWEYLGKHENRSLVAFSHKHY